MHHATSAKHIDWTGIAGGTHDGDHARKNGVATECATEGTVDIDVGFSSGGVTDKNDVCVGSKNGRHGRRVVGYSKLGRSDEAGFVPLIELQRPCCVSSECR